MEEKPIRLQFFTERTFQEIYVTDTVQKCVDDIYFLWEKFLSRKDKSKRKARHLF